ncbi:MAG: GvpL/GvpF family gas vesicle protein [Pseudomonadota bacterium]
MSRRDFIAVLAGPELPKLPEGLTAVSLRGFTAVLGAKARLWRKSVSRKAILEGATLRQRQIEALMVCGTVLPALPGMTIEPGRLPDLIAANAPLLTQLADELFEQAQFQVSVSWEGGAPNDDGESRQLTDTIEKTLSPLVTDRIALPRIDRMVWNNAILLPASDEVKLDRALAAIDAAWSDRLRIRVIGPSPALSFASLGVRPIRRAEIAAAKAALDVSNSDDPQAIHAARQAKLRIAPPEQWNDLRDAAALLMTFSRCPSDPPPPLVYRWQEGRAEPGEHWRDVA